MFELGLVVVIEIEEGEEEQEQEQQWELEQVDEEHVVQIVTLLLVMTEGHKNF